MKYENALEQSIKNGVEQVFKDTELLIGMTIEEVIKKQIPKKPVVPCSMPVCPVCDSFVVENKKYCPECGQALEWEEVEVDNRDYSFL